MSKIVIVGAGQAGSQCAMSLRQGGFEGSITLLGDESHLPYDRPPLSKAVLKSEMAIERTIYRSAETYAEQDIDLRVSTPVQSLDQAGKRVVLADGSALDYDTLIVATGARARSLPLPEDVQPFAHLVRSWDESLALKAKLEGGAKDKPLVVIGGGFIGLEVAASARLMGWPVIIVEADSRLMGRAVHPRISELCLAKHRAEGARVELNTMTKDIQASGDGLALTIGEERIEAAGLVIGIGALVNTDFLQDSSIYSERGVLTDAAQRSADPNIFAIGDVAICEDRYLASGVRLESVQNAIYGAKLCAAAILGKEAPRQEAPWFWTDQYDYGLQMVGLYSPDLTWIERDNGEGSITLIGLEGDQIKAGQVINASQDFAVMRRAVDGQIAVDPASLNDTSAKLKALILKK